MNDFIDALRDPDIPILRDALWTGLAASVALGIIGTYVVTRRISSIAGAISHSVLGGIGAALYLQVVAGWRWCDPMYGAVAAALLAAVVIGLVSLYAKQREDTVIGALWAVGMAVGLLFFAKTPGYTDPMSYLFGNILTITRDDLWHVIALDVLVVGLGAVLYNKFFAVCFDQEFAELRGVRVKIYYMLLLCLTALTVVLLVRVVGTVMVIAMLTLPAAIAGHFARQLWQMMILAVLGCMVFTAVGLGVSYRFDAPSGPVIIILAAATYLAVVLGRRVWRTGAV
ncbi:MAG: metal ABC transporter permease [Thermoguttaceae bacterium]|jgi:zinc transport system permease protein